MSVKIFEVDGLGSVRLQKRRGTRHLRLTLSPQGEVHVSLPAWTPYKLGLEFVKNKRDWIEKHRAEPTFLTNKQAIGKAHRLEFLPSSSTTRPTSRLTSNTIRITYPAMWATSDTRVQQAARRGAIKALQAEAEALLPGRLQQLAARHDFRYRSLRIKHLHSKWGSCDQTGAITLNSFLMTLPWDLIDYVLLHELMHTKVLRHGEPFWQAMQVQLPKVQAVRKELRRRQPTFHSA